MAERKPRILFICTANINRSRAAEDLFANHNKYEVRSAGFEFVEVNEREVTGQILTQELVDWAKDMIFVMDETNDHHHTRLVKRFKVDPTKVHILDIPDVYRRGNGHLVELLKSKLAAFGIVL